ncbi:MAG: ubiquinone/menaquinone biosynthesis methyltransferase [Parcubacteria group bacterium Gr01-1014_38]|nr:MAG: ubiquinone/menaquinone biosynthesis methyltransferase [Parcubacteria group bacterium Gr01-1014_38]
MCGEQSGGRMTFPTETVSVLRCPACGRNNSRQWKTLNGWRLEKCTVCGMIYVSPRPSEASLLAAYALPRDEYDNFFHTEYLDTDCFLGGERVWIAEKAREQLGRLHRILQRKGKIFELGCGGGQFLEIAAAEGWETAGVDPGDWVRSSEKDERLGIQRCSLFEARLEAGSFDAVFMASVLEHIAEPERYVVYLQRLLKNGGLLFISGLPNVQSLTILLGIDRWIGGHPPLHLLFFSRRSARTMLERLGFADISIRSYGIPETLLELIFRRAGERVRNDYVQHVYRRSLVGAGIRALRHALYGVFDITGMGSVLEISCFKPPVE